MPSLCDTCEHVRQITSGRGSVFLLCQLSQSDPRFAKYPSQPVVQCTGYVSGLARDEQDDLGLNDD